MDETTQVLRRRLDRMRSILDQAVPDCSPDEDGRDRSDQSLSLVLTDAASVTGDDRSGDFPALSTND